MSKEETKNKETNGVRSKLLGKPGWWDAWAKVNVYGEDKKKGVSEVRTRVLAQTAYFAQHDAARDLTYELGVVVHPEHVRVDVSSDQTDHEATAPKKKVNGAKRKRK